ncbi:hypothetical protein C8R43DRAFT_1121027 [Mycena crocata]|nr:hypothetical protein C8R43DRAFT_1121027 [Mycena crocata]
MPPKRLSNRAVVGTVTFRNSKFVDTAVGVDGEGTQSSQVIGDRGIHISNDGSRRSEHLHNVSHKKRRLGLGANGLTDKLSLWIPVKSSEEENEPSARMDRISTDPSEERKKRKSYASSDNPMSEFSKVQQLFLEESLRWQGLGYSRVSQRCALCLCPVGVDAKKPEADGRPKRFFRCGLCGVFLQCQECCIKRHSLMPLHFLEEWNGKFWERTSLQEIGLVYQLGHEGFTCNVPDPAVCSMTVLDSNGIHEIHYHYCACDRSDKSNNLRQLLRNGWYPASKTDPDTCATYRCLDLFRLLNVVGNINARDFITALERLTDPVAATGLKWMPNRYKSFLLMSRQYAFLQRVRRAGRGHDPAGLEATKAGECAVICWACPYDGRNLPANWRDVDPKHRFVILVSIQTNFGNGREFQDEKSHSRSRTRRPIPGAWLGRFRRAKAYKRHLQHYIAEKDISTCIAFAALTQKDTRNTTGLRVSGVGGCVCARHECIRPNGLGDLQKGERYANMDYILMSALTGFNLMELGISYDIACQWKKNFDVRMQRLPETMRLDFKDVLLDSGLPVWHALAHEDLCAALNNLTYILGVGRTDGEGVERLWAFLNSCAYQSKEMGLGNRADTIEDKLDSHNFLKNIGLADALRRKLIVALAERARQVAAFKEINKSISSEVRADWQRLIDDFNADRTAPNPYIVAKNDGPSEAQIRASLKTEEQEAAKAGAVPLHATSATAFLAAGLGLEETQRRIKTEIAAGTPTADRQSKLQEHRLAFITKLRSFRELQAVYTPGAVRCILAEEAHRDTDLSPPNPEFIRLWLPSELPAAELEGGGCQHNIVAMEATMREGQCNNALSNIRMHLHSKRFLITFRDENITGQKKSTRSRTIISQLSDRVDLLARKYRQGYLALCKLKGPNYAPHLKELKAADLILEGEEARDPGEAAKSDRAAIKKLARIGSGKTSAPLRNDASSKTAPGISWIWIAPGALDESEEHLHESLRVDWARAKARKNRWEEEVELLREEMRRVLRYLDWYADTWDARASAATSRTDIDAETKQGMEAYAAKQSTMLRRLRAFFKTEMGFSVERAVSSAIAVDEDIKPLFEGQDVDEHDDEEGDNEDDNTLGGIKLRLIFDAERVAMPTTGQYDAEKHDNTTPTTHEHGAIQDAMGRLLVWGL